MSDPENLTPAHLRCGDTLTCPSIQRLPDGKLLVVGQRIDETTPLGDIGDNEAAVIISPDLLDTLKAEWVTLHEKALIRLQRVVNQVLTDINVDDGRLEESTAMELSEALGEAQNALLPATGEPA